jgi:hypothetical protein
MEIQAWSVSADKSSKKMIMKTRSKPFALLLTLAIGIGCASAQSTAIKVVCRQGNDLFIIGADGKPQPLTNDGIPKGNPLWSKDGTKIAFERQIDETAALHNLIVMDPVSTTGCNALMKSTLAAYRTEDRAKKSAHTRGNE